MHYESVNDTAARLGVTVRAVQKWAQGGKIPDATRVGKQWLIPTDFSGPEKTEKTHQPMPLLNAVFSVGQCEKYIGEIVDNTERDMALAEFYYFSGEMVKSAQITEKYLNSHDVTLAISANAMYGFANIGCGRLHLAQYGIKSVYQISERVLNDKKSGNRDKNAAVFFRNLISVLMHIEDDGIKPLYNSLEELPKGLRIFGAYLLAHKAYL